MLLKRFSPLLLACSLALPVFGAPEIPREPILRIETGTHLATITRGSSDAAGNWLVTASEDKTARLWDIRSGRLVSVLRPPIGAEASGALYAAALSPDGRQVALGGNSAFDGKTHAVYLFDRASGNLPPKSTLSGLEAPLTQLAWSRDSQLLAIGLRQEGLRVFRRNLGFVGADPEYNEAIYGAEFATDGRLATASLDGFVRIYVIDRNGLQRVARKQLPGGKPYQVSWSPDGRTLAVGMQDSPQVILLDANTLNLVHRAEVSGGGNLGRIAWSADGRTLYAAGSASSRGRFPVYAFADRGRDDGSKVGDFANIVTGLSAIDGGVIATSAEPSWTVFDNSGNARVSNRPQNGDFRDAGDSLRVSADGQTVAFPMQPGGRDTMVFDFSRGELRAGSAPDNANAPRQPRGLSDWKNATAPQWNGRSLELRPGERARSAVALPDGRRFALGSDWNLRLYADSGAPLWEKRVSGVVWGVAASGDGRWLIAALGDGSLRWYRVNDGQEQLALFVHGDRERWIAWTPSGYYDTSMGGENLVGWHVNRAFNQAADFFSVGRFRDRFYQPGVIQKLLQTADEGAAVKAHKAELAALDAAATTPSPKPSATKTAPPRPPVVASVREALPPVIELQGDRIIETSETQVPVRYAVRTPGDAPVKDLKVRVNGKLDRSVKVRSMRGGAGEPQIFEALVPVPPKDSEILLVAENKNAKSEPVTMTVRRPSASAAKLGPIEKYDTLYMLIVAVNKYPGQNALSLPVKDAEDFRRQMLRIASPPPGKPKLYDRPAMKVLMDENATQENIREGMKWLRDNVKAKDAGVIFLAGHGQSQDNSYYYIPYNAKGIGKPDSWVSGKEIVDTLQNLPGRAMFFLDTCHSGALANQAKVAGTVNQVEDERGVIVFASATAKELAQETEEWGNGAFTKALIEGLRGEAEDPRDKLVYPSTLKRYVTRRVRDLTENQQRPYISDHGVDDPIAVVVK